jgi:hypothetical protein
MITSLRKEKMRYNNLVKAIMELCPEAVMTENPKNGEIIIETGYVSDMGELVSVNSDRFYELLSDRHEYIG